MEADRITHGDEDPFSLVDEAAPIPQLSGQSSDHRQRRGGWFWCVVAEKTDAFVRKLRMKGEGLSEEPPPDLCVLCSPL